MAACVAFAGATVAQDKPAAMPDKPAAEAAKPAAPGAAPAAKKEEAKPAPQPNKGDTAWMLTSTALVLMMSVPALALFYGGMVRSKNVLSMLMQVFVVFSLVTVLWCIYGYSLAFTEGNAYFGGFDRLFLKETFDSTKGEFAMAATFSKNTPMYELVFVAFQATFAAITCCLVLGAFAERAKFSGVLAWTFGEWLFKGRPSMLGAASGCVAGLVAITPAAGNVGIPGAFVIGIAAGLVCLWGVNQLKRWLGADDALDVFGIHAVGGALGALLTGVFNAQSLGGPGLVTDWVTAKVGSNPIWDQFVIQAQGVGMTIVWTGVVAFIAFKIADLIVGLRPAEEVEREGLDIGEHGETAYHM